MKAFRIWIPKFNDAYDVDAVSFKLAESAGKARYDQWLEVRESYSSITLMDIKVKRAPELDNVDVPPNTGGDHSLGWKSECRNCHSVESYGLCAASA